MLFADGKVQVDDTCGTNAKLEVWRWSVVKLVIAIAIASKSKSRPRNCEVNENWKSTSRDRMGQDCDIDQEKLPGVRDSSENSQLNLNSHKTRVQPPC